MITIFVVCGSVTVVVVGCAVVVGFAVVVGCTVVVGVAVFVGFAVNEDVLGCAVEDAIDDESCE